jgi:YHS domain-containing protein
VARLLIWALIGYVLYMMFKGRATDKTPAGKRVESEETHLDPVCGMYVTKEDAIVGRLEEKRIYFCSMACLEKYRDTLENKPAANKSGGNA